MSRKNKVNRDHYVQRGRLTPDEAAREMVKQRQLSSPSRTEGKPHPPSRPEPEAASEDEPEVDTPADKPAV